jgi:hypothetical protein
MRVEVDQSGKIERTSHDTVVAFSNDFDYAILIPARVKREIIGDLRSRGKRRPHLLLFTTVLYELLRRHLEQLDNITIDVEYEGSEPYIKLELLRLIWQANPNYPADRITFRRIGKKSAAHKRALATYRGKAKADRVVTKRILTGLLRKQERSGKPFRYGL